jgi:hypothetical protein
LIGFNPAEQQRSEAVRQEVESYASNASQYANQQAGIKVISRYCKVSHVHAVAEPDMPLASGRMPTPAPSASRSHWN